MITMDTIYNYTATANVEGKKDRLRCANGKSWIKRMYSNAENSDLLSSVNDDFQDYKVERNILIVVSLTIVLSICLGKSRHILHSVLLSNFSGINTKHCKHCQRNWVPSELSYRRVNKLSQAEIATALSTRGINHNYENSSAREMSRMRNVLKQCVYIENISFRRPWSFLYHSSIFPCRWRDFPVNEWIVVFVAILYLLRRSGP